MNNAIHAVGISGSLRRASSNSGFCVAQANLPEGMTLKILDISEVPLYNADRDKENRTQAVAHVLDRIEAADALVFACPEYNYSIAPALKNVIDWASREPDNRILNGKPAAIMGSGGGMGTSRAQYHLGKCASLLTCCHSTNPKSLQMLSPGGLIPKVTSLIQSTRSRLQSKW
jgi:chromate reductase